jgi:hypothetical protein
MHLVERYATACGVKIDKPYIYENFFPLPVEKYITFQPYSKYPSKNYDYWEEVVLIILPYLQKNNINIIQIGGKDDKPVANCINVCGQTKISQVAFIINKSIMHFGADSFAAHIASGYGKKIVGIYSNNNINNVKPYWTKPEDMILLKPNVNKKPQYSVDEIPKSINSIKPEQIAKSILDLLNIKYDHLPETLSIGEEYTNKTLEVIPDQPLNVTELQIDNIIVRMDYEFNEQILEHYLQNKKCIIITDKPINENLLKNYKQKIPQLIYVIDKNNDPTFAKVLKRNAINYTLISYLEDKDLNEFKLEYMDYGLIIKRTYPNKLNINYNNAYFKSSKILLSGKGQFSTKYQWIKNDNSNKFSDDLELQKELNNIYIFSLDQK